MQQLGSQHQPIRSIVQTKSQDSWAAVISKQQQRRRKVKQSLLSVQCRLNKLESSVRSLRSKTL